MKAFLVAVILITISSCAPIQTMPPAQETATMRVMTAGSTITKTKPGKPYGYQIGIVLKANSPTPAYAIARFENPDNPSKPLVATGKFSSAGKTFYLESPLFAKRPEVRTSSVTVELYRDASRKQKIDELRQDFITTLPSDRQLREAGLGHLVP